MKKCAGLQGTICLSIRKESYVEFKEKSVKQVSESTEIQKRTLHLVRHWRLETRLIHFSLSKRPDAGYTEKAENSAERI